MDSLYKQYPGRSFFGARESNYGTSGVSGPFAYLTGTRTIRSTMSLTANSA